MIKQMVPLRWRIAARKLQKDIARRFDPDFRASFVEDYVRVYDAKGGDVHDATIDQRNNFLNHQKFYRFAAQFVRGGTVLDAGSGSGHGCALLADAGAASVLGVDMSEHALAYARDHYGRANVEYRKGSVTKLELPDRSVDVVTCAEVLEHVLEFGTHRQTMRELARVLKPGGLAVMATPNAEMLPNHGYRYEVLRDLVAGCFPEFAFFENAFLPFLPEERANWDRRSAARQHGVRIQQDIRVEESCAPPEFDLTNPEHLERLRGYVKPGDPPGSLSLGPVQIDTRLLHNTHSFVVVARKS